ncbi:hypothetical protein AAGF08_09690 [Algoriphagus sp. SE2]|uniref:hypothetical protein n=1 Tax=Algoriphagus sp. SE2 TaxID=3141536 RepID=UPI0031CD0B5B
MHHFNLQSSLFLFILSLNFSIVIQDYSKFKRELDSIYFQIEDSLLEEGELDYLQNETESLLDDLEGFLKDNDDLAILERSKLVDLQEEIEVLTGFFYVIDKNNGQIEGKDFYKIIEKIGGELISTSTNSECANLLEVEIGDYKALFFENHAKSTSYNVSYEFVDKRYNLSSISGEMGLIRRNVRHISNSRDNENFDVLRFKSISCVEIDYPF